MDKPGGVSPELRRQHPVKSRGRASSLQVTEHHRPDLAAEPARNLAGHDLADPTELHLAPAARITTVHETALGQMGSFSDHDQRVSLALAVAVRHRAADVLEVPRDLRQQDHVATTGDARMQRDPAGMAAHHFEHHHPLVAGGGRVQSVECVGRRGHSGVEAEREGGAAEVVVDRLGHAHHGDAMLVELLGDAERPVAPHADQSRDPHLLHRGCGPGEQFRVDPHPLALADERREPTLVG